MTTINNIYFPDTSFTLKEVQDILRHKKKKLRFRIVNSLNGKREWEILKED